MRASLFSLKEFPIKAVLILMHATKISTEQTSMRTKSLNRSRFKTVQEHFVEYVSEKEKHINININKFGDCPGSG